MPGTKTDWLMSAPVSATNAKADTALFPFLMKLIRGENLTQNEAADFYTALTAGDANPAQMAAALTALTAKGETAEELAGMAGVMRGQALVIKSPRTAVDIAGTGSSTAKTFNVSTAAAIVAAGAGLTIAKQCNRGVTTKVGSADVLGELGVKIAGEPPVAQASLSSGLAFLFAPKFHPNLRRVGDLRRSLGIRTCLNILGLLANPAGVSRQLIGVWHRSLIEPTAKALSLLKTDLAWIVHGSDGFDEITLTGETFVAAVKGAEVRPYVVSPADFGLKPAKIDHLTVKTAKESAAIITEVLSGKRRDEARSLVVLNAAAALIVGGLATEPMHAARLAEQSIDSGMAQNKLERLIQFTSRK
ncbi:MAG: anthranilate phosphoribosyltransferase [Pyrinomonadaceae bacterium]